MTDKTELTKYTEIKITPEYLCSLPESERKTLRNELYQYPEEGLNYEFCEKVKEYKLLHFDLNSNEEGSKRYKGTLQWDTEELDDLDLGSEINISQLKEILKHNKDISYEEAESLFNADPNLLLTSMSLIANNYNRILTEVEGKYMYNKEVNDIDFFRSDFLFTNSEEKIFLTGRTLLKELSQNSPGSCNGYIEQLTRDIDTVILKLNIGLIRSYAKRYEDFVDKETLFQEGAGGILRALTKFDIDKGYRFSTYAMWWIQQAIRLEVKKNASLIKRPTHIMNGIIRFNKIQEFLKKINGEDPTFDETWEYCCKNDIKLPKDKEVFRNAMKYNTLSSLDEEFSNAQSTHTGSSNSLYDHIESTQDNMDEFKKDLEDRQYLDLLFEKANLSEDEKTVIMMRHGLIPNFKTDVVTQTFREIAEILEIPRHRISQIHSAALKKLASAVEKLYSR
ncbi:sigma-70 family RNA polymerase sigma factor [Candidatus Dojkabacteria bacterium]|jgi:RNA polymerase sigma factor (sigma-70 family)|nr:sigma-70 family RNA polymerase sigma factor [Candidatus Dojkabacteria bacterium]